MERGLVSVIVPVFNREHLVAQTLDSILSQTYTDVEIVAVNDGSTDGSLEVLRSFEARHPGKVVIIDQPNAGQIVARNNGIRRSRGDYVAFLDSDDSWLPGKLDKQLALMAPGVGLVYCGIHEVDESSRIVGTVPPEEGVRGRIYDKLLVRNRMTGGTVVLTREAVESAGLFDTNLEAAENWDLWIRVAKDFLVDYVDEALVNYRKHAGNMSGNAELMLRATRTILAKHMPERPGEPALAQSYDAAHAHYFYLSGLRHFARGEYREARCDLRRMREFTPGDAGTRILIARTYLGKTLNRWITSGKQWIVSALRSP